MALDIEEFMRLRYFIGQPLFEQGKIFKEGMYYRCQDKDHLVLFIMPDEFTMLDRSVLTYEEAEFAVVMKDAIIFLMIRFKGMGWFRAHFFWHFVPKESQCDPVQLLQPDGTSLMHLLIIDKSMGCIQGVRKIVLPQEFTQELHGMIQSQIEHPPITLQEYHARVGVNEYKYFKVQDMASEAKVKFTQTASKPIWYKPITPMDEKTLTIQAL